MFAYVENYRQSVYITNLHAKRIVVQAIRESHPIFPYDLVDLIGDFCYYGYYRSFITIPPKILLSGPKRYLSMSSSGR